MSGSDTQRARARVKERRQSPRLRIDPLVYLNIPPDNGGFLFDLGEGGMGIRVANPLSVTGEIQFSFLLNERQPIQGQCKLCWLSETGRSAGVRFVRFPEDSRTFIREWLRSGVTQTEPGKKSLATAESTAKTVAMPGAGVTAAQEHRGPEWGAPETRTPEPGKDQALTKTGPAPQPQSFRTASAATIFSPGAPRPGAMESEESAAAPPFPENNPPSSPPETPLFFFPRKTGPEDAPQSVGANEPLRPFSWPDGRPVDGRDSEETAALQSAVLSGSPPEKNDQRKKGHVRGIGVGIALCAALATLALLAHSYPAKLPGFHQIISQLESQLSPQSAVLKTQSDRLVRRVTRLRFLGRHRRGNQAIRQGTLYVAPSENAAQLPPADANGLAVQVSPGTPVGQSLTFDQTPGTFSNRMSGFSSRHAAPFSSGLAVSMTSSAPNVRFEGMMGNLRNDGALVVEGVPVSIPPGLDKQAVVPKPIVLEALIGTDGAVKNVRLISSADSRLARAVIASVKQWRYRPFYENGRPVEFTTRITFNFSMSHRKP